MRYDDDPGLSEQRAHLMGVAREVTSGYHVRFGRGAADELEQILERGLLRAARSEVDKEETSRRVAEATRQLVTAMAMNAQSRERGTIDQLSLEMTMMSVCPLWPFC